MCLCYVNAAMSLVVSDLSIDVLRQVVFDVSLLCKWCNDIGGL